MFGNGSDNNGLHRFVSCKISINIIDIFNRIDDGMLCATNFSNY